MGDVTNLNLIHFLDFYFTFIFFAGLVRRFGQYKAFGRLALTGPGRWPLLLKLISEHRTIFVTWATVIPLLFTLLLSVAQLYASRSLFPEAGHEEHGLTVGKLLEHWLALFAVAPLAIAMFGVDLYFLIEVGEVNRSELEKYFDQAEYWLRSPTAHVVRVFTLGYISPRRMVNDEVKKALVDASRQLNSNLWWFVVAIGLRVACGLSLWLTWALTTGFGEPK